MIDLIDYYSEIVDNEEIKHLENISLISLRGVNVNNE
jgi:hypothetical protein